MCIAVLPGGRVGISAEEWRSRGWGGALSASEVTARAAMLSSCRFRRLPPAHNLHHGNRGIMFYCNQFWYAGTVFGRLFMIFSFNIMITLLIAYHLPGMLRISNSYHSGPPTARAWESPHADEFAPPERVRGLIEQ